MPNKAIFFDRDGTLNVDVDYLHEPADFVWVEGAIEAIRWANEHGYLVIVVTNQSGIARGYYDEAAIHRLHDWMNAELAAHGVNIVIYANQLTRSAFPAMERTAMSILKHHRALEADADLMPFKDIIRLIDDV